MRARSAGIKQRFLQGALDFKNILRIDQQGRVARDFRQTRRVRRDDRRSVRHGFERRQAETLIERGKHEDLGDVVENAQHFDGHESKKAHIVLHAAADYGAAQAGMSGKIVADNDRASDREVALFLQFGFESGEGFDGAHDIFVRPDRAGIEEKWIVHLVAFGDQVAIGSEWRDRAESARRWRCTRLRCGRPGRRKLSGFRSG